MTRPALKLRALRRATVAAAIVISALLASGSPARADGEPTDDVVLGPTPTHADGQAEMRALRASALGRWGVALDAYEEALTAAIEAAAAAAPGSLEGSWATARAEVYVRRLHYLRTQTGLGARVAAILDATAEREDVAPSLRTWALFYGALAWRAAGEPERAEERADALGLIRDWLVLGPFDNEQGQGFAAKLGPEGVEAIDLAERHDGKERSVGWRVGLGARTLGWVNLDAMLRPNDQALAYALCAVKSDAPRAVDLRIGSDEAIKVWANGALIHEEDVQRTGNLDQTVIPVQLPAGETILVVKVCDRAGGWGMRLRITDTDGRPAPVAVIGAAELAERGTLTLDGGAVTPRERRTEDAIATLARVSATRPRDPWPLYHRGYLHYTRHAHDATDHPDREAFTAAIARAPRNAFFRVMLSFVSAARAELSVQREENAKRAALEEAIAIAPGYAEAHLLLGEHHRTAIGNLPRAEHHIDAALAANPDHVGARLARHDILRSRGHAAFAKKELTALAAELSARDDLPTGPQAWRRIAIQHLESSDIPRSLAALDRALAADADASSARREKIALLTRSGRLVDALAEVGELARYVPDSAEHAIRTSQLHDAHGDVEAALAACDDALAVTPDEVTVWLRRGHLARRLGEDELALASFHRAAKLDPSRTAITHYIELLQEREDPWWEPHLVKPREVIAAAAGKALDERTDVRYLSRVNVIRVQPDGLSNRVVQEIIRIENDDGVRRLDSYAAYYYAGEQQLAFRRARVWHADGTFADADTRSGPSGFGGGRRGEFASMFPRSVDLPPLRPGDVVEIEYRTDDLVQGFFGEYFDDEHDLAGVDPIDADRYVLITPAERTFHINVIGVDDLEPKTSEVEGADGKRFVVRVFERRDVPRIETETAMPWAREVIPRIQVSTFGDWDEFARWYWGMIREQHESSDELRRKVRELCAGKSTEQEKIRAIYDFVVTEIRYNDAWEFGIHGFKPYKASSIFSRRFGDCKDKATLIKVMLDEVGIEAHPVLIRGETTRGKDDLSLPLIGHFNHCIAWVKPTDGEGFFVDGTAEYHPVDTLPTMDYGADVVIIHPDGGKLATIADPPSERNSVKERHKIRIAPDGSAILEAEIETRGNFATVLRQLLSVEAQRKQILERLFGRQFEGAELIDSDFPDMAELKDPITFKFRMRLPKAFRKARSGLALEEVTSHLFRALYLDRFGDYAAKSERSWDVELPLPMRLDKEVEVELPPGYETGAMPRSISRDEAWGSFERSVEAKDGTIRFHRKVRMNGRRIPKADYEEFRKFAIEVDAADELRPIVKPGSGRE